MFCKQTCTKFLSDIFCFAQTLATNIIPLIIHFWLHQPHSRRFVGVEKFIRKVCERHATWLILPDWLHSSFFLLLLYNDQRGTSFVVHKTAKLILFFLHMQERRVLWKGTFTWWSGEPFYEGFQVCHDIKEAKCFYIYIIIFYHHLSSPTPSTSLWTTYRWFPRSILIKIF